MGEIFVFFDGTSETYGSIKSGGAIFLGEGIPGGTRKLGELVCRLGPFVDFVDNKAEHRGGAIASIDIILLSLDSLDFHGNFGQEGAAVYVEGEGYVDEMSANPRHHVEGKNISYQNNTGRKGGALFLVTTQKFATLQQFRNSTIDPSQDATSLVVNNVQYDVFMEAVAFIANKGGEYGGGIYAERGRLGCRNCSFVRNHISSTDKGFGGAIYLTSGAMFLVRVILDSNAANDGGAIFTHGAFAKIVNATIVGNNAQEKGGGLCTKFPLENQFDHNGFVQIIDSKIMNNMAKVGSECLQGILGTMDFLELCKFLAYKGGSFRLANL